MWRGGALMQPPLKQLGLTQVEKVLPTLFETARQEQWTYELFLTRAVAAEIEGRDRRAAERRMSAARFPAIKTLEAFDFAFQPSLSERLLWELADLSFVQTATNVLFLGPPGTGKTHLSLALAVKALSAGYSALFTTLTHLAEALDTASYPGLVRQRLRRYTTPSVLVIDEVGYTKLSPAQALTSGGVRPNCDQHVQCECATHPPEKRHQAPNARYFQSPNDCEWRWQSVAPPWQN